MIEQRHPELLTQLNRLELAILSLLPPHGLRWKGASRCITPLELATEQKIASRASQSQELPAESLVNCVAWRLGLPSNTMWSSNSRNWGSWPLEIHPELILPAMAGQHELTISQHRPISIVAQVACSNLITAMNLQSQAFLSLRRLEREPDREYDSSIRETADAIDCRSRTRGHAMQELALWHVLGGQAHSARSKRFVEELQAWIERNMRGKPRELNEGRQSWERAEHDLASALQIDGEASRELLQGVLQQPFKNFITPSGRLMLFRRRSGQQAIIVRAADGHTLLKLHDHQEAR